MESKILSKVTNAGLNVAYGAALLAGVIVLVALIVLAVCNFPKASGLAALVMLFLGASWGFGYLMREL